MTFFFARTRENTCPRRPGGMCPLRRTGCQPSVWRWGNRPAIWPRRRSSEFRLAAQQNPVLGRIRSSPTWTLHAGVVLLVEGNNALEDAKRLWSLLELRWGSEAVTVPLQGIWASASEWTGWLVDVPLHGGRRMRFAYGEADPSGLGLTDQKVPVLVRRNWIQTIGLRQAHLSYDPSARVQVDSSSVFVVVDRAPGTKIQQIQSSSPIQHVVSVQGIQPQFYTTPWYPALRAG